MSNAWYYADHGRAKGPISTEDLVAKIQRGELSQVDLVFREGNGEWQPIEKFKEITSLLSATAVGTASPEADWIVLRVIEVDGREKYEQIGPYNVEQVLELIDAGRIKFNDFVWKTGFETWVPLGKLDKFDKPLASSVEVDQSLYDKPRHLKEADKKAPIKAYAPVQKSPELKEEEAPEEAEGPDLAQPSWALKHKEQKARDDDKRAEEKRAQREAEEKRQAERRAEEKRTQREAEEKLAPEKAEKIEAAERSRKDKEAREKKERELELARDEKTKKESAQKSIPQKVAQEVFDFGNSLTNFISPLKGPKKAPTEEPVKKVGNPLKYEAIDMGEKTQILKKEPELRVEEKFPVRKPQRNEEHTSTAIPPVVVTKVVKKETRQEKPFAPSPAEEFVAPPPPAAVEKMRGRWNRVGYGVVASILLVVAGILAVKVVGRVKSPSAIDIAFEDHPSPVGLKEFEQKPTPKTESPSANNLPAPDMGVPPEAQKSEAQQPTVAKTGDAVAPAPVAPPVETPKVEEKSPEPDVAQMSTKQKSFFHQQERMAIFYNSKKGLNLAGLLDAALKKKNKTPASWKKFYTVWQGQVKTLNSKIQKEVSGSKVHPKLAKSLKAAGNNLDKLGKDINSQMVAGRTPTKDLGVDGIIAEFKKINAKAKSLDQ